MANAVKKAAAVNATLVVNDDGSLSVNVELTDADGLPITTLPAWPAAVALPTAVFSDASPGPSSGVFTPAATPTLSTVEPGAFVVGAITAAPAPNPLPVGWGQDVDVQVSIASGLANQSAPIAEDAGTFSWQADSSKPSGFSAELSTP